MHVGIVAVSKCLEGIRSLTNSFITHVALEAPDRSGATIRPHLKPGLSPP
jgi:hypothetical protein